MQDDINNVTIDRVPAILDNAIDPPLLLDIREAAALLTVSVPTIRRLQQQRCIPFIKVGRSLRFLRHDLLQYVSTRRVDSIGK